MKSFKPFQDSLAGALSDRKKKNPAYSLRTFAMRIGVTANDLSMILDRQKFPTPEVVTRIGEEINVASEIIESWQKEIREQKKAFFFHGAGLEYNDSPDECGVTKWYHVAIVELFKTRGFKSSYSYISQALGIELNTTIEAVTALERNEIVTTQTTPWSVLAATNAALEKRTNVEREQLQKDLLEISISAIDAVAAEERVNASQTIAIHADRLPEAKDMIEKFRRELAAFLGGDEKGDSVYHLTVGLFPTPTDDQE